MTIGILVTARMGSTRLRDKHLRRIGGVPALSHLLARITAEFAPEIESGTARVLIATGQAARNSALTQLVDGTTLGVFNGDDDNVPLRHLQAARALGLDGIVSVDGDDLLCAPEAMRAVFHALRAGAGLAKTSGLPLGMNSWGYSSRVLEQALEGATQALLETGWGRIFTTFPCVELPLPCPGADLIRATLDYEDDLTFFSRCFTEIDGWARLPTAALVGDIVTRGFDKINAHLNEEYWANFSTGIALEAQRRAQEQAMNYSDRLNAVIPGGAHTYSRGDDQYPANAPQILKRGQGAYVWTPDDQKLLDYGMALRAVSIGYAEPEINAAATEGMELGNSLTRASLIELEAAEKLVDMIDSVDMVKFTKNGSTATSAAVKLARAYTGRDLVARCTQHPFFSFDDWFIGSTPITKGIPANIIEQTKQFAYNDIASLEALIAAHPDRLACVILEPAATETPAVSLYEGEELNYLQQVERLCRKHGIVFILDETITGFRWHLKGAQHTYGVNPDISTFGKAMANGFSVAAIGGRREIMELGAINRPGLERLFLLSTTHGAEMSGLNAYLATMRFLEKHGVIAHLWEYGGRLVELFNAVAQEHGMGKYIRAGGPAANPFYATLDAHGAPSFELRTLFSQEMIKRGVLMPWLAFSYRHGEAELRATEQALQGAMKVCAEAMQSGLAARIEGDRIIKPVFRRFN